MRCQLVKVKTLPHAHPQFFPRIKDEFSESNNSGNLRVRLNSKTLAWCNERFLGNGADKRARARKSYKFLVGAMLRRDWEGTRGLMPYTTAKTLLRTHQDYPRDKSDNAQRQWVSRIIKLVCTMPGVTKFPRYIMFETMLADHGGIDAIEQRLTTSHKRKQRSAATRSQRARDYAKFGTYEPKKQIVTLRTNPLFTENQPSQYNASPPSEPFSRPTPSAPKHRRSSIVASRPMPSASAKQGNIPGFGAQSMLPSCQPQILDNPVSFRSRSDNAEERKACVPRIPGWLDRCVPPKPAPKGNFDPKTNPAAKRVAMDGRLTGMQVRWVMRQDKRLASLTYTELHEIGATDDLLYAAYDLFSKKQQHIEYPKGMLKALIRLLRSGTYRYA